MVASDEIFVMRVSTLVKQRGIPREDAIEIIEQKLGRSAPASLMRPREGPAVPQHVYKPAPRTVTLSIGGANIPVTVSR
jgi:hypothetical protein